VGRRERTSTVRDLHALSQGDPQPSEGALVSRDLLRSIRARRRRGRAAEDRRVHRPVRRGPRHRGRHRWLPRHRQPRVDHARPYEGHVVGRVVPYRVPARPRAGRGRELRRVELRPGHVHRWPPTRPGRRCRTRARSPRAS
jgi:hypothetical protein